MHKVVFALVGIAACAAAQNGSSRWWAWPKDPDAASAERGRSIFAKECADCHAANATGTAKGSNLIRSALVRHDKDGSAIAAVVNKGAVGMPRRELASGDIQDVIAFIELAVQKYDRVSPGPPPDDYPVERLLTGDAAKGKVFFNGTGGCIGCHSVTGDLAGIAAKYPPVFLQSRFLMPRATKPRIATVTLASGEKVTGELKTLKTYDVALQDASGKLRTWVVDDVKVEVRDPLATHRELLERYTDADVHNMFAYLWTLK